MLQSVAFGCIDVAFGCIEVASGCIDVALCSMPGNVVRNTSYVERADERVVRVFD